MQTVVVIKEWHAGHGLVLKICYIELTDYLGSKCEKSLSYIMRERVQQILHIYKYLKCYFQIHIYFDNFDTIAVLHKSSVDT